MGRSPQPWGYHQLHPQAARRLVRDARLPPGALVLDIGAGTGAITAPLLDAGASVIAVELHPGRAHRLTTRFGDRVTVARVDARDLRLPRRPFHVVANPPFAISAAVLRRLLQRGTRLQTAHIVLPAWTVQRWLATNAPGRPRWERTFELRAGPALPPHAFRPAPRARSQVLVVRRR